VAKLLVEQVPPFTLALGRNFVALVVLLPLAFRGWPDRATFKENAVTMGVAGLLGTGAFNALVYHALQTTSAINAVMMMSLCPTAIPLISFFMVRERFRLGQVLGIGLSLSGVAVIVTRGEPLSLFSQRLVGGDGLMFFAMLCWSLYTVLAKRRTPRLNPYVFFFCVVLVATLALLPFAFWEWQKQTYEISALAWLAVIYVGIVPTAIAIALFNRAVVVVGANTAGAFQHLVPVFGTIMAIFLLGEHFGMFHAVGALVIALGLFAAARQSEARP
jgi:drug/metabolite transporter (DMT)-like permease